MCTLLPWIYPQLPNRAGCFSHTTSHKNFTFGVWWTIKHREICHAFSSQTFVFSLLCRVLSPVWTDWFAPLRGRKTKILLNCWFHRQWKMPTFHSISKILAWWWWVPCHFAWLRHWYLSHPMWKYWAHIYESVYNLHNQSLSPALCYKLWMSSSGHLKALWNRSSLTAEQVISTPQGFTADIKHVLPNHIQLKTKELWELSALQRGVQGTAGSWECLGEPVLEPSPACRAAAAHWGHKCSKYFYIQGFRHKVSLEMFLPRGKIILLVDTF